jgi:hypothetical protein
MMRAVIRRVLAGLVLAGVLAGCRSAPVEQRSTQGPTAETLWSHTVASANRREPTFDERRHWENQMEAQIERYLREHPEVANSLDVSTFRFLKQVTVGMTQEQVRILLGAPTRTTKDAIAMELLARKYWREVRTAEPTEAWVYPLGWTLFFKDTRLVDATQYLER